MPDKIKVFYDFENFRLDTENPSLWRDGRVVSISPKALELLIVLVERRGEIVSREELLESVWKDTFVEEGNINYTVSLLRKTLLNKDLIQTVPRRGYRFTAEIREIAQKERPTPVEEFRPQAVSPELSPVVSPEISPVSSPAISPEISPVPAAPADVLPSAVTAKAAPRWVLVGVILVTVTFLTGFAVWWNGDKKTRTPGPPQTQNAEAKQAYTRGKMIIGKRNVEDREEKAIDEFQKAITFDPTFALAYAGLAEAYGTLAVKLSNQQGRDAYIKAKSAAEKALALDENLAEGFLVRGWLKRNADWNWPEAEADLRRAIELSPKNAIAHQRLAQVLCPVGKLDEALAEARTAYELDPISDFVLGARFPILEARREYDQALKESEEFVRENKNNNNAMRAYATFLYHKGDFGRVIELGEQNLSSDGEKKNAFAWLSLLAASLRKTGQPDKANEALQKLEALSQTSTKALYSLAMNYAENGNTDEAIETLEKCFEKHEERMSWLRVEPRFANLQNDSRFGELLRKMNLN